MKEANMWVITFIYDFHEPALYTAVVEGSTQEDAILAALIEYGEDHAPPDLENRHLNSVLAEWAQSHFVLDEASCICINEELR